MERQSAKADHLPVRALTMATVALKLLLQSDPRPDRPVAVLERIRQILLCQLDKRVNRPTPMQQTGCSVC